MESEEIQYNIIENLCERKLLTQKFANLYQRIFDEITQFLNKSKKQIIFFELPFEELSNKTKQQNKYWIELCDVITLAIRISLKQEKLNPEELSYPGNWYHKNDKFLLIPNKNDTEKYYYICCEEGKLTFTRENKPGHGACALPKKEKNNKIKTAQAIYNLQEIPLQSKKGFKVCQDELQILNSYSFDNSYSSAMLLCSPCPTQLKFSGIYVKPVVELLNNNSDIPSKDVAIVIGDKALVRLLPLLNSVEPYGPTKKLLIFGSLPSLELIQRKPQMVILTFLDFHNYCAPKKIHYHNPKFIEIEFPWLKDSLTELKKVLEKYQNDIGTDNARYIYNFTRKVFADINFSSSKLNNFKGYFVDFVEKILENIYNEEVFNDLETWLYDLPSYNMEVNPKQEYAMHKNAVKTINLNRSIRNQLKELEGYGNLIIIDAPLHKNDITYPNPITTVMRYHNFAEVQCVYYKEIETGLMKYSSYNFNQDILYPHDKEYTEAPSEYDSEISNFRLEDYFDYNEAQNNFICKVYDMETTRFTDGTSEYITGDVLVEGTDGTLTRTTFKDIEDPSGLTIIYYSQNNNEVFDQLVSAKCKFPQGKDINYYSNLWQDALNKLIVDLDGEKEKEICKEIGISLNVLKNHLNGESKFMRREAMKKTLQKLISNQLITQRDAEYVLAARKFMYGNNISFGSQLKNFLFEYKLSQNKHISPILQSVLDEANLSINNLIKTFLNKKTIK